MNTTQKGSQAEQEASEFWIRKYPHARLLQKNFRVKAGEIDLVFEVERTLVFIEVRTRSKQFPVEPIDSITSEKRKRLNRAIQAYLQIYRGRASAVRIDYMFRVHSGEWTHLQG